MLIQLEILRHSAVDSSHNLEMERILSYRRTCFQILIGINRLIRLPADQTNHSYVLIRHIFDQLILNHILFINKLIGQFS